ncbi:MAG: hypothetical protein ABSD28_03590 [Tepidisphaeraceae bacterium]
MLILRLKQCERALADGRLDEAFDLACQGDVRAHRRGQQLIGKLLKALIDRGRRHLAQGRLVAAAADADKAVLLGGNLPEGVQLQEAVRTARRGNENVNQQAAQALALARRHAEQGQLTVGQQVLAESPVADPRLDCLKQDLAARRAGLESRLKRATEAFNAGDWEAAIDHIAGAGRNGAQDAALRLLADRIADHVATEAATHVESGRLDTAAALLERLGGLPAETTATRQLRAALDQCRAASDAIAAGQHRQADETLRRLQVTWPKAGWIGELAEQAGQWGQVQTAIQASPLSLLAPTAKRGLAETRLPTVEMARMQSLVLHIDGVGSFQVLPEAKISIGPLSSTRVLDLPLMMDAAAPAITLSRSEEDYFLIAERPATVNEVPCMSKLLNSGDRIGLGARCRLTFRRPSAASGTAVLDISGARLPGAGIRQVILLDREIVIGPGAGAHVRADELPSPVVLIRSPEGLACRSADEITIDGRRAGNAANLPEGAHVSIGSLRFVISREQRP